MRQDHHRDVESGWVLLDLVRITASDLESLTASGITKLIGRNVNGHRRPGELVDGVATFAADSAPAIVICTADRLEAADLFAAESSRDGIIGLCEPDGIRWGSWNAGSASTKASRARMEPPDGFATQLAQQCAYVDSSKATDVYVGTTLYEELAVFGNPYDMSSPGLNDIGFAVIRKQPGLQDDEFMVRRFGGDLSFVRVGMLHAGLTHEEQNVYGTLRRGDMPPYEASVAAQLFTAPLEPLPS